MDLHSGSTRARLTAAIKTLLLICLCVAQNDASSDKSGDSDIAKRLNAAAGVFNEIMATPDKAIPNKILTDAQCIAVVPSMIKIALIFGGNHGKGVATCRTANGWSGPAPITVTGGSWGLQLGGQATDLVMLVMNQKGMEHLLSSKFKIGADASAAAGPVGRDAAANTDWKMKAELLTYSRSRGLFAGIDLSGSAVTQDRDATHLLYRRSIPFGAILTGRVPPPKESQPFLSAVKKYAPTQTQTGSLTKPGTERTNADPK